MIEELAENPLETIRSRYAARLGVALFGAIVLLLVVGIVVQGLTAAQVQDDAKQNLATSADVQSDEVEEWAHGNQRQVRTISRLPVLQTDDDDRMSDELSDLVDRGHVSDEVVAIHVVDKDEKQIVASSRPDTFVGKSPAEMDEPFVPRIKQGFDDPDTVYVSTPFHIPIVDFPVVAMLSKIPDQNRVVVFMINPTGTTEDLRQPVEGGHTHVITADGDGVASPGNRTHEGSAKDEARGRALDGETGVVVREDGSLMGFAPVETRSDGSVEAENWIILTHVDQEAAFALLGTVRNGVFGMVFVALLALGLVGATVGRSTTTALRSLSADARRLGDGDLGVEFDVDRPDELGTLAVTLGDMRDSLRQQITEAEDAREEAELRRQRTEQFNEHLETKATEYGETLSAVADGDLTRRVDPDSDSEAMRDVGESINDAVASLAVTLAEVKAFAAMVDDHSGGVDAGAEDVWRASEEASAAVQEISDGAARQHSMLDDVASEMETLSATAEEAASATDELATTSEAAAEAGDEGREAARAAIEEMNEVEAQTEQAVERIETLDEEMAVIGEVTELITEIAEQTNILALNASIEAARAGEAGEGFGVVADEVKDLAEETREAAADIEERIEGLQEETDATVEDIQVTRERLATGVETVEQAIGALESIAGYVQEADAGVKEISQATAEQARSAQSVASMVGELTTISEQTTTEAQTVASAAEEQTATLTEVSESASDLSARADDLQRLLADFEVDEDVEATEIVDVSLDAPLLED